MRPLPSDSTTARVPESARAKFAPDTATLALRNLRRRCARAAAARRAGSLVSSGSTPSISRRKMSRTWLRFLWMAGTRMWLGLSWSSWTMSSARSVSNAAIPCSSRYSLRPISWVAMDLTLTTSSAPCSRMRAATILLASPASRAQWMVPPRAVKFASNSSSSSGSRAMTDSLIARPASRSSSQSGSSDTTASRLSRMVRVAWPRFARSWVLPSSRWAAFGKGSCSCRLPMPKTGRDGIPRNVPLIVRSFRW